MTLAWGFVRGVLLGLAGVEGLVALALLVAILGGILPRRRGRALGPRPRVDGPFRSRGRS